jgi:hypothetical protein
LYFVIAGLDRQSIMLKESFQMDARVKPAHDRLSRWLSA